MGNHPSLIKLSSQVKLNIQYRILFLLYLPHLSSVFNLIKPTYLTLPS